MLVELKAVIPVMLIGIVVLIKEKGVIPDMLKATPTKTNPMKIAIKLLFFTTKTFW